MFAGTRGRTRLGARVVGELSTHSSRLGLTVLLALGAAMAPLSCWSACALQVLELPVKMVWSRPIVTVGINGTQIPMLLDTGAFFSSLTESAAAQLHLPLRHLPHGYQISGFTGPIDAHLTKVDKVQFIKGDISNVEFLVGGNAIGGGAMGVLGRNFLNIADTEYDLAHGLVRLAFPSADCAQSNLAYWAAGAPVIEVPLTSWRGHARDTPISVALKLNGKEVQALLDTGAPETSVHLRAARRAGIAEADMVPGRRVGGAGRGHAQSWMAPVESFELGGERITHIRLQVTDADWTDDDVLVGLDYFLSHRIYVARSQRRMYATWNGVRVFGRGPSDATAAGTDPSAAPEANAPSDADGLARRGAASAARGDFANALDDFNRACALDARSAGHFAGRARVHLALEQGSEALMDFDEALRLDPAEADARLARAQLRKWSHDRDGAVQDLRTLDLTLPPEADLRAAMADAYIALEMPAEALHQWDLWMPTHRHEAELHHVLNLRCWTRMLLNIELDGALEDCRQAVDGDPKRAAYQDSLGWVQLRRGEHGKAIAAFDRSLGLRPDGAWSLYGRGIARRRLGQMAQAESDLAAARKLSPGLDEEARRHGIAAD